MLPITKPDKKVPTHGPGTTAWYRGKEAKILAIENGKAKIFCNGRVLLVNYTSLDDTSFKTLHETYCVVDSDSKLKFFSEIKNEWSDVKVNETKNKKLFDKIEKWYSALSIDQKENLFYNLFRFTGQATKMAKKYKTLTQFVKMGTKNTPESGGYKHTGFGTANAIATYYQSFKTENDILSKLASIKMDNSKDYLKYHDLAKEPH